jgi:hypothetical protein
MLSIFLYLMRMRYQGIEISKWVLYFFAGERVTVFFVLLRGRAAVLAPGAAGILAVVAAAS